MPLGGSVTYGVRSSTGNGYRAILCDLLISHYYNVHLVGSRNLGTMANSDNEGCRGYRLNQIKNQAKRSG
ncbi:Uncharacterized protein HZ326_22343 [Fusarium oxysporum f. sp. albedinis]|nr:Uncharacterized protein HZ326_22343 [Fusarium oxysporum f. sp. albedinis]